jgi:hypothetical protein
MRKTSTIRKKRKVKQVRDTRHTGLLFFLLLTAVAIFS